MASFCSKQSELDALVISQQIVMTGLNLHHACSKGIILQYSWNYWTIEQIKGRLFRMGQKKVVQWYIITTAGTFAMVQEDKMCRKIIPEFLFCGTIPDWIVGKCVQRLVAYEIARLKFGHPWNRFVWVISPPSDALEYKSRRMVRMGRMASAIAESVLAMDFESDRTRDLLRLLNVHLIRLLHWWGDDRALTAQGDKSRAAFDIQKIAQYAKHMGDYMVTKTNRPFWASQAKNPVNKTIYDGWMEQVQGITSPKPDTDPFEEEPDSSGPLAMPTEDEFAPVDPDAEVFGVPEEPMELPDKEGEDNIQEAFRSLFDDRGRDWELQPLRPDEPDEDEEYQPPAEDDFGGPEDGQEDAHARIRKATVTPAQDGEDTPAWFEMSEPEHDDDDHDRSGPSSALTMAFMDQVEAAIHARTLREQEYEQAQATMDLERVQAMEREMAEEMDLDEEEEHKAWVRQREAQRAAREADERERLAHREFRAGRK